MDTRFQEAAPLQSARIAELLHPYLSSQAAVPPDLFDQLARYLALLLKWNARTNLTAIRKPDEIVRRHFGESLFTAQHLGENLGMYGDRTVDRDPDRRPCPNPAPCPPQHLGECGTLLDFGSGGGFPGLPIQLFHPSLAVTLAESQNKKASFLREAVRALSLPTEVWAARVEAMPPERQFDVVTMRAVDRMETALNEAALRARSKLMLLSTAIHGLKVPQGFELEAVIAMTQSSHQTLLLLRRMDS